MKKPTKSFTTFAFILTLAFCESNSSHATPELSANLRNQEYYNIEHELRFKTSNLTKEEEEVRKSLINRGMLSDKNLDRTNLQVGFASFNLDQSSLPQVFVYYGINQNCTDKCRLEIYSYRNSWQILAGLSKISGGVAILKSESFGLHDIALSTILSDVSQNFEWNSIVLKWTGNNFKADRTVRFNYKEKTIPLSSDLNTKFRFTGDAFYLNNYKKEFFTTLSNTDKDGITSYYVGNFGDGITYHPMVTWSDFNHYKIYKDGHVTTVGASYRYKDLKTNQFIVAIPFSVSDEDANKVLQTKVGITLIDESGNLLKSDIIESRNSNHKIYDAAFLTSSDPKQSELFYRIKDQKNHDQLFVQKVEMSSLTKIGNPRVFDTKNDSILPMPNRSDVVLNDGTMFSFTDPNNIHIADFPLRDLRPDEIFPNYILSSGDNVSNPKFRKTMVTFGAEKTTFSILPNPNSAIIIWGFMENTKNRIALPITSFNQINIYGFNSGQYSNDDVLEGKFIPSTDLLITKKFAQTQNQKRTEIKNKKDKFCAEQKKELDKKIKESEKERQKIVNDPSTSILQNEDLDESDYEDDDYNIKEFYSEELDKSFPCEYENKLADFSKKTNTLVFLPDNQIVAIMDDPSDIVLSPEKFLSSQQESSPQHSNKCN